MRSLKDDGNGQIVNHMQTRRVNDEPMLLSLATLNSQGRNIVQILNDVAGRDETQVGRLGVFFVGGVGLNNVVQRCKNEGKRTAADASIIVYDLRLFHCHG